MVTRPPGGGATTVGVRGEVLVLSLLPVHLQWLPTPRNPAIPLLLKEGAEDVLQVLCSAMSKDDCCASTLMCFSRLRADPPSLPPLGLRADSRAPLAARKRAEQV